MSSPPPTKPPRGVKQGKETSGLLMSVIRTLSASETNEQREKERAKLEKEYKKSDARLDELVAAHAQEITDVMQKFTLVGEALSTWGTHCEAAVGRLTACRGLLRLRRADLRRLWMDARTHHYALQMLTDIERVVVSEREAREALQAGRILAAAHTLRTAIDIADETLSHVTALNTTRQHLEAKKRELVDVIVRRVSDAVYHSERAPLSRRLCARRRTALLLAELTKSGEVSDSYLQDVTPELEASLTEEDVTFESTVVIALEALAVLEQLKEAAEKFKVQIQNELLELINSVSRRVIEEGDIELDAEGEEDSTLLEAEGVSETGRPLARLVTCLGEEFRACAVRNKRLLQVWRAALQRHKIPDTCLHSEHHYWGAVQQVLQLVLTEYLEIESVSLALSRNSTAVETAADWRLADHFAKKRPQRRRVKLFKLSTNAGGSPARTGGATGGAAAGRRATYPLVCVPAPDHLHALLPPTHLLCHHIEQSTGGGECSLRAFIANYVRAGESERLANLARTRIEQAMRAPQAWRERGPPPPTALKNCSQWVIFSCVGQGWAGVERAAAAARRCGPCGGPEAARAVQAALATLATVCRAAHTRLAGTNSWGRAARWLADDDIVRFLQALPNWRAAVAAARPQPQELVQAYEREAEILGSSLGDGAVTRKEVIADINALADIALLAESMAWLSANIKTIPSLLSAPGAGAEGAGGGGGGGGGGGLKLSDRFVSDTVAAACIFDEIAHKCLLLLHLELRIQCFYYLGQGEEEPAGEHALAGLEAAGGGAGAALLARQLLAFHEQAAVLHSAFLSYVIGGLGEMMSAAVVWRWRQAPPAPAAAAALATLRHCLAALGLPHSALHRAYDYLHLLDCTPQEIIESVREKGAQFSELEYLGAMKAIAGRLHLSPADMRAHLADLAAALGHVGVTV